MQCVCCIDCDSIRIFIKFLLMYIGLHFANQLLRHQIYTGCSLPEMSGEIAMLSMSRGTNMVLQTPTYCHVDLE